MQHVHVATCITMSRTPLEILCIVLDILYAYRRSYVDMESAVCMCRLPYTVFIRIVAVATINFSLTGVWLLIEGGSYWRKALFILDRYLYADPVVSSYDRLVFRTTFRIFEILWSKNSSRIKPGKSSVMLLPGTDDRSWRTNVATPT